MPDYINWYLVELRLRLQPHLSQNAVEGIVSEVESHLCETSLKLRETPGMTQLQADLEAVRAFGQPQLVATTYLQESNPKFLGLKPLWVVLVSGLAAIGCWVSHWISLQGYFDNFGATWQNGIALMIGLAALTIFVAACRAGHRSYFRPLLALGGGTAIGLVFLLSFWIVGSKDDHQGFSRIHLGRDEKVARISLKNLDRLESYLRGGVTAYSKAKSASDLPLEYRDLNRAATRVNQPGLLNYGRLYSSDGSLTPDVFTVPSDYVSAYVDGRIWGIYTAETFAEAKKAWIEKAGKALGRIDPQREGLNGLLASAEEARSGRLFFFNPRVYADAVIWAILFMPVLLTLNSVAFAWRRRRPVWPSRQIA
jgi:hypothetical protein